MFLLVHRMRPFSSHTCSASFVGFTPAAMVTAPLCGHWPLMLQAITWYPAGTGFQTGKQILVSMLCILRPSPSNRAVQRLCARGCHWAVCSSSRRFQAVSGSFKAISGSFMDFSLRKFQAVTVLKVTAHCLGCSSASKALQQGCPSIPSAAIVDSISHLCLFVWLLHAVTT